MNHFVGMQLVKSQPMRFLFPALAVFIFLQIFPGRIIASENATNRWWPETTEAALSQAGTNRQELATALEKTPAAQREEIQFLIENASVQDLQKLSADFLSQNVALADDAFQSAPWKNQVPREIFLNDVLPYACVNETRDDWRPKLRKICAPLVADCKTPGEAACRLNENIFKIVNVRYSTAREKADQSPAESMSSGLASCTGLSILLVDACRSVGVPARFAGTPMWTDNSGNHSWVEIWDGGWHFLGAAEPDANGLDHAWFKDKAATAIENNPTNAIYAASFKKTGLAFPLDWAPDDQSINAVNVTARYAAKNSPTNSDKVLLQVKVVDAENGRRIATKVAVNNITNSADFFEGVSEGESADMNNVLSFDLPPGIYQICASLGNQTAAQIFIPNTNAQQPVILSLNEFKPLNPNDEKKLKKAFTEFFEASDEKQAQWKFSRSLEKLLFENEPAVRQAAWESFKAAPVHDSFKQDFDAKQVRFENYTSPYTVKFVGERPTNGWALFIAMHGGGGAPKELNDEPMAGNAESLQKSSRNGRLHLSRLARAE